MPSILVRYFLKRWGFQVLVGFVFFGGLLMAWEVRVISQTIFEQQASLGKLIPLLLTTIPWNVGLILPMAAVLGGLLGTQQLSEGSEIVASQGLGYGMRGFLKPWMLLSIILMICSIVNAHWISPAASRMKQQLFYDLAQESLEMGGYIPKVGEEPKSLKNSLFHASGGGGKSSPSPEQLIYWGKSKDDGRLHIMQIGDETISHLIADRYFYKLEKLEVGTPNANEHINLTFRFEDVTGKATVRNAGQSERIMDLSYEVLEVNRQIEIQKQDFYRPTGMYSYDTSELLAAVNDDTHVNLSSVAAVELSRRFSNPLACCALLLLGIALGLSHPRFYKGGAVVKSIGVILLYFIVVKVVEGWIENNLIDWIYASLLLPFLFFCAAWVLLFKKMYPTRHGRQKKAFASLNVFRNAWKHIFLSRPDKAVNRILPAAFMDWFQKHRFEKIKDRVIGRWTSRKWWANFAAVLTILLVFYLFIVFAELAPYVVKSGGQLWLFIKYWIYNLPVTLPFLMPVVFLLAWSLTFSDVSVSREWTALRAGGVSLIQWVCSSWRAWGLALLAVFAMEVYLSPKVYSFQHHYYRQILGREERGSQKSSAFAAREFPTTLFLGSTNIFWFSDGDDRWGFPLSSRIETPALVHWVHGQPSTHQLDWDSNIWRQGPHPDSLFPDKALRRYQKTEEVPTLDLFVWQSWAPNADRGTLLWGRLLKWLAGPCLLFAALGYSFPAPRRGRGQALAYGLVLCLVFMWMQHLFEGASRAGQIPPLWGILAPMLILIGFGMVNLRKLQT